MKRILVSACLLGCACRYDGKSVKNDNVIKLGEDNILIPVCPEQLGGLPTPRTPSERIDGKVISRSGADVTEQYNKGAETALYIYNISEADFALLKARSPSCGRGIIYDGTFSGNFKKGNGVTAELFIKNGIEVFTEEELEKLPI